MSAHERERDFGIEELFFSTTDRKGIITSGNRVFQRVAAYEEAELLGQPHSLIRHPDVPRCVFKLLWDTIGDGRTIAAYVKNRAKTGEPYWVMATVVPCKGGYLSVRLKPSTPYFEIVQGVYKELRALELELGGERELERKRAMAASGARLGEILAGAGFPNYETFMHAALAAELGSRAAQVAPPAPRSTGVDGTSLGAIRVACMSISGFLDSLFGASLDGYVELADLNRQLVTKSAFVLELAESLRLFSLNALLASTRLGDEGVVLGSVADIMRGPSDSIRGLIRALSQDVDGAAGLVGELGFRVSVARLQSQMVTLFVDELLDDHAARADESGERALRVHDLALLSGCLDHSLGVLFEALGGLDRHLGGVAAGVGRIRGDLNVMRALEINGRIEAARATDAAEIVQLFHEIRDQITAARTELADFAAAADLGRATASAGASSSVRTDLQRIHDCTAQIAA